MDSNYFDTLSREHLLFLIIGALAVLVLVLAYRVYFFPSATSDTLITTVSLDFLIEGS